jgi:hypothetical protein
MIRMTGTSAIQAKAKRPALTMKLGSGGPSRS